MLKNKQLLLAALLIIFALLGQSNTAQAEQLNNSVKDCFEHPDKCKEKNSITQKETSKSDEAKTSQVGVTFWDFLRMIVATIFVIGLLYFLLKFINKKSRNFKTSQLVENLGGTSLGANRSVQVVKAGNQILIVGVGESIQLLKEINDPKEYQKFIDEYNNKMDQLIQPSDIVTKLIERTKNIQSTKNEGTSFSAVFKNQLDDFTKGRKKLFDELDKERSDKR
ncbi:MULTISPECIES: flagellar biosynthetic protein FliO [unclassified Bacillus (in: firmicutes)]|uniref:flagellar biosynthetic protein FliO n=1 Tax=unclassified Bacillus (in: firmicutes) TaxID=185979 RepID=UPI0008E81B6F|nr:MULTISPECIES: flagellar biosynthetic protein FliO [unclassified Bacillus (in: firmicutes)]SFA73922.1 flagellar protein FliO/FliZ [Bacillus sp. UNCCL13]SFQ64138.1 flagellar protein FliO/FliZ [Bacillus sp. cl95]